MSQCLFIFHVIFICPLPGAYKSLHIKQACNTRQCVSFHPSIVIVQHSLLYHLIYVCDCCKGEDWHLSAPRECILTDPSCIQCVFVVLFLVHLCCPVHHHFHPMTIQSLYVYFLHNLSHPFHHIKVLMTGRLSNHM